MKTNRQEELSKLRLTTEYSEPVDDIGDITILLYGREKIGKTSIAARFPDSYFLMVEPGGKGQRLRKDTPLDWLEFKRYVSLLGKSELFQTVVIDTVDIAYSLCEDYVLQKLGIDHQSDEKWGKGWKMVRKEFSNVMTRIANGGRGVIFISHATEREIERRDGTSHDLIVPTMGKQAREILEPMVDLWAYFRYSEDGDRELVIRGDERVSAGHRLDNHFQDVDSIPMGLSPQEGFDNFVKAFNNELEVEEKPKPKRIVVKKSTKYDFRRKH